MRFTLTSIISTHQMPEGGLSISPCISLSQSFRSVDFADVLPERVVRVGYLHGFESLVVFGLMNGHVKNTKMQLTKVEQGSVQVLGLDQFMDQFIRDPFFRLGRLVSRSLGPGVEVLRRQGRVVSAQRLQLRWRPAPIFQHLAGRLHEVPDRVGTMESGIGCPRHEIVDAVSEFVEECGDLFMLQ